MRAPEGTLVVLVDRDVAQLFGNRVVHQQGPATGGARGGLELALLALVGAEVCLDAVAEFAVGLAATARVHAVPENR